LTSAGDDGFADRVVAEVRHEGPVDLDDVDGELVEVAERGVAGAEVVERDHGAEILQVVEHDQRPFAVAGENALGDRDAEVMPRALLLPATVVGAGPLEHPLPDVPDQRGLLGQWDEGHRRHRPTGGMVPAQESLQSGDCAVMGGHHRLVDGVQLAATDRVMQVALEPFTAFGQRDPGVEDLLTGARAAFGLVYGGVRVAQHLFRVAMVIIGDQPGDDVAGLVGRVQVLGQDDELIAVQAGHGVRGSEQMTEPARDRHQQLISDAMSVGIVDGLEAVQVKEQHGRRFLGPMAALQGMVEEFQRQRPVGQSGERIVQGQFTGSFRGSFNSSRALALTR
jgi:hypothetical protein